jgi:putative copper export protein
MTTIARFLHLLAAAYWLGGLITLAVVAVVALRSLERPAFRLLFRRLGRAFLLGSVPAWLLLAVTGIVLAGPRLTSLSSSSWGQTLEAKIVVSVLVVIGGIAHAITGARTSSPIATRASRILAIVVFLLTLGIFYLAAQLTNR